MKKIYLAVLVPVCIFQNTVTAQVHPHNTRLVSIPELTNNCRFFSGDTLQGFDLPFQVKEAALIFRNTQELKRYVFGKELDFVRKKFNSPNFRADLSLANSQRIQPTSVLTSACNNVDFENGNFTGWTGSIGYNTNSNGAINVTSATISTLGMNSPEPSCSYHTLVSNSSDPYSGLAMVAPGGGTYSVRLGGEDINEYDGSNQAGTYVCSAGGGDGLLNAYSGAEMLQQTFAVTSANALFSYSYAVILNDGGHSTGQQPYFRLEVLDASGNPIPCLQYYQQVASGVPPSGYFISPTTNWLDGTTVYCSPWTKNSLNLSAYIGQNITVRFTAAGCNGGAHFGYAYVDCSCGPVQVVMPSGTPCAGTNGTLTAPASVGGTYSWSGPGVVSGGNSQTVTVNTSGTYSVTVTSAGGCSYVIDTSITFIPNPTVTVNSGAACGGTSVALNASGATSYSWSPGTGLSATTGASVNANPSSTTVYTLTGSTGACSGTATATVTVNPSPTVTVSSGTICPGNSTTLNAGGAATYSWSPGTGLSATSGASVSASPGATTTYTITGTTAAGCVGTATTSVTVNPLPTVTASSGTICPGGSTPLTAAGASTYIWSPGTGLSATTGVTVTANPASTTVYTVTGTSASGCVNTGTASVTVNPTPTVAVTSATVCPNTTVTLTASGANTYSWNTGSTSASITDGPASTTNYTVTGTTAGCVNTATTSITIVSNLTITATSATICAGNSATLTASGAASYAWSPATGLSSSSGSSVTANPGATTVYTITGTAGTCSAVTTATVTVNPGGSISVSTATVCAGISAALNATGANTYTWTPSTSLSSSNGASVTANPASTTAYTVTGTDANGCVYTATTAVNVDPLPTISVPGSAICSSGSTILNASGASSYTWSPAGSLSSATGSSVTASPASTTQYTITGTDANGCTNSDTATVTVLSNAVVSVNSATICPGGSASLTASGASTYTWSPAGSLSSSTGSTVTASPLSTTVYTINASAGTCTATGTATVTVVSNPSITVNSAAICSGSSTSLTANGATSYTWTPATGLSSSTGSTVTANPSSTTVYTITGTLGTCSAGGTSTVTVNSLPVINANPGFICNGGSATLTANGGITYTWSPAATLSSSTGTSVTANPASTTQYTIVGTDAIGCVNSGMTSVTVVTNPTLSITGASICSGQQTATLTAGGATNFNWAPNNGLSGTSGSSVVANPSTTTVYTITGTIGSCTATATTTVTVIPLPNISASSNSPVCVNGILNLNAAGGNAYLWTGPGGYASNQQNNSITGVTAAAAGVYTVTGTDANLCYNAATVSVTVNPLPVVTAMGSTVCTGSTIILSANNGGSAYSWSGPNGYSSSQQNPTISNANVGMVGSYVVTVTDMNGCANGNVAQVAVNPSPVITVTPGSSCAGAPATMSASGANTFTWSPAAGLSTTTGATVVATVNASTTYTVSGSDANGCVSSAPVSVTINPLPQVSLTPLNSSGCAPLCVNFNNTSGVTGNCNWNFGDGVLDNSTCAPQHCFTIAGTYSTSLTLTDGNGCTNTAIAQVIVYPQPTAGIYAGPQPTSILEPLIQFTDNSTGAVITSWSWNFGDAAGSTSTLQNPAFSYAEAGNYQVQLMVTSDHGCISIITQIIQIDEEYALYVPNAFSPNSDGTNDEFKPKGDGIKDYQLYVFDRWGNQVFYSDDLDKGWDGRYRSKGEEIVQEDVYVWKIELKSHKGAHKTLSGTVTLLK